MALSAKNPITGEEFVVLVDKLRDEENGKHQNRGGIKRDIEYFCVVWCDPKKPNNILGHITGPEKNHATFVVRFGKQNVEYLIKPESECEVSFDRLNREIKHALKQIHKKVENGARTGPMGTKGWDGFYLFRSSKSSISKSGGLDRAVATKQISASFRDTCLSIGIYMRLFK